MSLTAHQARDILVESESGILLPEFCVWTATIDLLAVDDHSLRGYEIKAATDRVNDRRFHNQLREYRRAMELLTYVVAPKFLDHCRDELPEWVGIQLIDDDHLTVVRPPQPNPEVTVERLSRMLWKPEALAAVKARGLYYGRKWRCPDCRWGENGCHDAPSRKCGSGLGRMLVEHMADDELRLHVRRCVANRNWTAMGMKPRQLIDRRQREGD